jgi:L-fuculose-phosphate aldolase
MNNIVILENHGLATGGSSLLTAFQRLETLDFCARTLIRARGLGSVNVLSEEELDLFDRRRCELPEIIPLSHPSRERDLRKQIVDVVHRAYARYLMISTEGVVSARVDNNSFLVTPTGKDRGNIALEDIVLVKDGGREKGKQPSRSAHLHQAIYDRDPAINCVIMAQCPNVMAYATTSTPFETRTIPESYILLREMQRIPFRLFYENPDRIAGMVSLNNPVSLVQNDCVLVAGKSVLDAFDRLEVAEYSARSLIDTGVIGTHVPIGEEAIRALEYRFSLS